MKEKIISFLERKVYMDTTITACLMTFVGTIAFVAVWLLILAGGWNNLLNTAKYMQVLSVIDRVYVGDASSDEMSDEVFTYMIASLEDRWSYYMTEDEYDAYMQGQSNSYVGIGITLQQTEDGYIILAVAADSPAEAAGVTADTYLIAVNGLRLNGQSVSDVSAMMRENPDHVEIVTATADGIETTYQMAMQKIYTNPVSHELLEGNIGYIQIANFDESCADASIAAVDALIEQGAEALIFDVRNNGGGYLSELSELLDYLLPEGEIFVSVMEDGEEQITHSDAKCVDLPMAVLVNENTYSAAEFFAAALREYDAATIVGAQTTGKNRSQINVVLLDGSAVHISSKRYLTPNRVDLTEQGGLTPDIVLAYDETDPQMAAAVELFR